MDSASSGPSSEQVRTIGDGTRRSSSSVLTPVTDESQNDGPTLFTKARVSLEATELPAKTGKRSRERTQGETVVAKKAKVKGEDSEKGIYCHQRVIRFFSP